MGDVVNLNRFRKERTRAEKRAEADANALKFGRTLADRKLDRAQAEKQARDLEGHKRDDGANDGGDTLPAR